MTFGGTMLDDQFDLSGGYRHRQQRLESRGPDPRHAFLDHTRKEQFTASVGHSRQDNDNTEAQFSDAFRGSQYALASALYTRVPNVTVGISNALGGNPYATRPKS